MWIAFITGTVNSFTEISWASTMYSYPVLIIFLAKWHLNTHTHIHAHKRKIVIHVLNSAPNSEIFYF